MIKKVQYKIYLFLLFGLLSACSKMDDTYNQYVVPGGLTYAGKASSPAIYPGLYRVKVSWLRGSDPTVTRATVYWNNYADSVAVPVPAGQDTISVIINDLVEKNYSFVIRTFDVKGNSSVPAEVFGAAYGDKYQSQLLTRPVNSTLLDAQGKATIQWGSADISNGAVASEVKYTNVNGAVKVLTFPATEAVSVIPDIKANTTYQFRTLFKPDSLSIDNFYTGYSTNEPFTFDKKDWSVIGYSDQFGPGDNAAINVISGTDNDRWHTNGSAYPHSVTIDMGIKRNITKFGVWRTLYATENGDDRAPTKIQFLVSEDNITWTDAGTFTFNNLLNGEQSFSIPSAPKARYFKFIGLTGTDQYMTLGEISAYGF